MRTDTPSVPARGVASATPDSPANPLRRRSPALRKAFPYLLLAPAMIYLLVITLYPGLFAIYQSLFVVKFLNWTWTGFGNYAQILRDRGVAGDITVERERKHFSLFHKLLFFVLSIC